MQNTQQYRPNIRPEKIFGLIIVVVFFGIFGLWAALAPLESAAIAPGKIMVSGYRKSIQHLEGGIVEQIYVNDGSKVIAGEKLVALQNTKATAALEITQNQLNERMAERSRLQAELGHHSTIRFPRAFKQPDKSTKKIINLQQSIFENNKKVFLDNLNIYKQRIGQLQQQIDGTYKKIRALQDQLKYINRELVDIRLLAKKKLVKQSRLLGLERESARLSGELGEQQSRVAQLQQKIGETQIEMNKLTNDHNKEILAQLRETQQKITDLKEQRHAEKDVLSRTIIRSPIDGVVVAMAVHTVGGVIKPGEVIMEIVPQHEALLVEVRISPLDIDVVHKGLKANVRVTAFNQRTTPMLKGRVTQVSADAYIDERTGQPYYKAQIMIEKHQLKKLAKNQKLYPGMPAEAMIVTNKLTPWEYFIAPIQRSFNRAFRED